MEKSATTSKLFSRIAASVAQAAGRPGTFALCVLLVLAWAVSGPWFGFSDTWQLVINTGTTIITFLMVFLIQNTQNRDGIAIQAKLDELIRSSDAQNRFVGIEHLTEGELQELRDLCEKRAREEGDALDTAEDAERKADAALNKAQKAEQLARSRG